MSTILHTNLARSRSGSDISSDSWDFGQPTNTDCSRKSAHHIPAVLVNVTDLMDPLAEVDDTMALKSSRKAQHGSTSANEDTMKPSYISNSSKVTSIEVDVMDTLASSVSQSLTSGDTFGSFIEESPCNASQPFSNGTLMDSASSSSSASLGSQATFNQSSVSFNAFSASFPTNIPVNITDGAVGLDLHSCSRHLKTTLDVSDLTQASPCSSSTHILNQVQDTTAIGAPHEPLTETTSNSSSSSSTVSVQYSSFNLGASILSQSSATFSHGHATSLGPRSLMAPHTETPRKHHISTVSACRVSASTGTPRASRNLIFSTEKESRPTVPVQHPSTTMSANECASALMSLQPSTTASSALATASATSAATDVTATAVRVASASVTNAATAPADATNGTSTAITAATAATIAGDIFHVSIQRPLAPAAYTVGPSVTSAVHTHRTPHSHSPCPSSFFLSSSAAGSVPAGAPEAAGDVSYGASSASMTMAESFTSSTSMPSYTPSSSAANTPASSIRSLRPLPHLAAATHAPSGPTMATLFTHRKRRCEELAASRMSSPWHVASSPALAAVHALAHALPLEVIAPEVQASILAGGGTPQAISRALVSAQLSTTPQGTIDARKEVDLLNAAVAGRVTRPEDLRIEQCSSVGGTPNAINVVALREAPFMQHAGHSRTHLTPSGISNPGHMTFSANSSYSGALPPVDPSSRRSSLSVPRPPSSLGNRSIDPSRGGSLSSSSVAVCIDDGLVVQAPSKRRRVPAAAASRSLRADFSAATQEHSSPILQAVPDLGDPRALSLSPELHTAIYPETMRKSLLSPYFSVSQPPMDVHTQSANCALPRALQRPRSDNGIPVPNIDPMYLDDYAPYLSHIDGPRHGRTPLTTSTTSTAPTASASVTLAVPKVPAASRTLPSTIVTSVRAATHIIDTVGTIKAAIATGTATATDTDTGRRPSEPTQRFDDAAQRPGGDAQRLMVIHPMIEPVLVDEPEVMQVQPSVSAATRSSVEATAIKAPQGATSPTAAPTGSDDVDCASDTDSEETFLGALPNASPAPDALSQRRDGDEDSDEGSTGGSGTGGGSGSVSGKDSNGGDGGAVSGAQGDTDTSDAAYSSSSAEASSYSSRLFALKEQMHRDVFDIQDQHFSKRSEMELGSIAHARLLHQALTMHNPFAFIPARSHEHVFPVFNTAVHGNAAFYAPTTAPAVASTAGTGTAAEGVSVAAVAAAVASVTASLRRAGSRSIDPVVVPSPASPVNGTVSQQPLGSDGEDEGMLSVDSVPIYDDQYRYGTTITGRPLYGTTHDVGALYSDDQMSTMSTSTSPSVSVSVATPILPPAASTGANALHPIPRSDSISSDVAVSTPGLSVPERLLYADAVGTCIRMCDIDLATLSLDAPSTVPPTTAAGSLRSESSAMSLASGSASPDSRLAPSSMSMTVDDEDDAKFHKKLHIRADPTTSGRVLPVVSPVARNIYNSPLPSTTTYASLNTATSASTPSRSMEAELLAHALQSISLCPAILPHTAGGANSLVGATGATTAAAKETRRWCPTAHRPTSAGNKRLTFFAKKWNKKIHKNVLKLRQRRIYDIMQTGKMPTSVSGIKGIPVSWANLRLEDLPVLPNVPVGYRMFFPRVSSQVNTRFAYDNTHSPCESRTEWYCRMMWTTCMGHPLTYYAHNVARQCVKAHPAHTRSGARLMPADTTRGRLLMDLMMRECAAANDGDEDDEENDMSDGEINPIAAKSSSGSDDAKGSVPKNGKKVKTSLATAGAAGAAVNGMHDSDVAHHTSASPAIVASATDTIAVVDPLPTSFNGLDVAAALATTEADELASKPAHASMVRDRLERFTLDPQGLAKPEYSYLLQYYGSEAWERDESEKAKKKRSGAASDDASEAPTFSTAPTDDSGSLFSIVVTRDTSGATDPSMPPIEHVGGSPSRGRPLSHLSSGSSGALFPATIYEEDEVNATTVMHDAVDSRRRTREMERILTPTNERPATLPSWEAIPDFRKPKHVIPGTALLSEQQVSTRKGRRNSFSEAFSNPMEKKYVPSLLTSEIDVSASPIRPTFVATPSASASVASSSSALLQTSPGSSYFLNHHAITTTMAAPRAPVRPSTTVTQNFENPLLFRGASTGGTARGAAGACTTSSAMSGVRSETIRPASLNRVISEDPARVLDILDASFSGVWDGVDLSSHLASCSLPLPSQEAIDSIDCNTVVSASLTPLHPQRSLDQSAHTHASAESSRLSLYLAQAMPLPGQSCASLEGFAREREHELGYHGVDVNAELGWMSRAGSGSRPSSLDTQERAPLQHRPHTINSVVASAADSRLHAVPEELPYELSLASSFSTSSICSPPQALDIPRELIQDPTMSQDSDIFETHPYVDQLRLQADLREVVVPVAMPTPSLISTPVEPPVRAHAILGTTLEELVGLPHGPALPPLRLTCPLPFHDEDPLAPARHPVTAELLQKHHQQQLDLYSRSANELREHEEALLDAQVEHKQGQERSIHVHMQNYAQTNPHMDAAQLASYEQQLRVLVEQEYVRNLRCVVLKRRAVQMEALDAALALLVEAQFKEFVAVVDQLRAEAVVEEQRIAAQLQQEREAAILQQQQQALQVQREQEETYQQQLQQQQVHNELYQQQLQQLEAPGTPILSAASGSESPALRHAFGPSSTRTSPTGGHAVSDLSLAGLEVTNSSYEQTRERLYAAFAPTARVHDDASSLMHNASATVDGLAVYPLPGATGVHGHGSAAACGDMGLEYETRSISSTGRNSVMSVSSGSSLLPEREMTPRFRRYPTSNPSSPAATPEKKKFRSIEQDDNSGNTNVSYRRLQFGSYHGKTPFIAAADARADPSVSSTSSLSSSSSVMAAAAPIRRSARVSSRQRRTQPIAPVAEADDDADYMPGSDRVSRPSRPTSVSRQAVSSRQSSVARSVAAGPKAPISRQSSRSRRASLASGLPTPVADSIYVHAPASHSAYGHTGDISFAGTHPRK